MKTITVKDETWKKLTIKKVKEGYKSLDELISYLLEVKKNAKTNNKSIKLVESKIKR